MTTVFTETIALLAHELGFWKEFVKTERFLNGWVEDKPTPELHQETANLICTHLEQHSGNVLDVGSGPVSILRGTVPAGNLRACDPLSPLYQIIFDYKAHGVEPPDPYEMETLPYLAEWQVVHTSNALDHCQNPAMAMASLFRCVSPGGLLVIQGFESEGQAQHYLGMHQWNMHLVELHQDLFELQMYGRAENYEGKWAGTIGVTKQLESGRNWLIWARRK